MDHEDQPPREVHVYMRHGQFRSVAALIGVVLVAVPLFAYGAWAGLTLQRNARAYMPDGYHLAMGNLSIAAALVTLWWATVHVVILLRVRPALRIAEAGGDVAVVGPGGRRKRVGRDVAMSVRHEAGPMNRHTVVLRGSRSAYRLRVLGALDDESLRACEDWLASRRSATR